MLGLKFIHVSKGATGQHLNMVLMKNQQLGHGSRIIAMWCYLD